MADTTSLYSLAEQAPATPAPCVYYECLGDRQIVVVAGERVTQ